MELTAYCKQNDIAGSMFLNLGFTDSLKKNTKISFKHAHQEDSKQNHTIII